MDPLNNTQAPVQVPKPPVKADSGFETIQKLLMVFIFILTVSMFSYWGYQAVMYILSASFGVATGFTPYDMFIGIIAMIASASLFIGSIMWWNKHLGASGFLKFGASAFIIKDLLEIPKAIDPLTKLEIVNRYDLTSAASAIGYDLFKIGFWILTLYIFSYGIKKYKQSMSV
ncbi:MAG: hypothetical protein JWN37_122 [Candidatus Nomurabacteria bacterium]|nr:hypothetical protein [Candidatus Nomurabacteria bacterium]